MMAYPCAGEIYEKLRKQRKFAERLIDDGTITEEVRPRINEGYDVKPNRQSEAIADAMLADKAATDDLIARVNDPNGMLTAEDSVAFQKWMKQRFSKGDYSDTTLQTVNNFFEKTTNAGQFIQALSMWSKMTPEGAVKYADYTVRKHNKDAYAGEPEKQKQAEKDFKDTVKDTKEVVEEIQKETAKAVSDIVDDAAKPKADQEASKKPLTDSEKKKVDAIQEKKKELEEQAKGATPEKKKKIKDAIDNLDKAEKKITEGAKSKTSKQPKEKKKAAEILAQNVVRYVESSKAPKPKDPEQIIASTLWKVAKQRLPEKTNLPAKDPLEEIRRALKNRQEYLKVLRDAKAIIERDHPEVAAQVIRLMESQGPEQSMKNIQNWVGRTMKREKITVASLVKMHYADRDKAVGTLKQMLLKEAGLTGREATYLEQYIDNELERRFGKARIEQSKLQRLNLLLRKVPPKQRRSLIDRVTELVHLGAFDDSKWQKAVAEKFALSHLTPKDANRIAELVRSIQKLPDGREKDRQVARLVTAWESLKPPTFGQKLAQFVRMGLINNLKTFQKNALSNAVFSAAEIYAAEPTALPIDAVISLVTGQRKITVKGLGVRKAELDKAVDEVMEAIYRIQNGLPTNNMQLGEHTFKTIFDRGLLGKWEKTMRYVLEPGDRYFYALAYARSLRQQLDVAGLDKPTPKMLERAHYVALYNTFQDETLLSTTSKRMRATLDKTVNEFIGKASPRLGKQLEGTGVGTLIMPFIQTLMNVLMRVSDYSPAGTVKAMWILAKDAGTLGLKGSLKQNQEEIARTLGRSLVGTTAGIGLGGMLFLLGVLSKGRSESKAEREAEQEQGYSAYSINLSMLTRLMLGAGSLDNPKNQPGDLLVPLAWMSPAFGPQLSFGAEFVASGGNWNALSPASIQALETSLGGLTETVGVPTLRFVESWIKTGKPMEATLGAATDSVTTFIPTLAGQLARTVDPVRRETKGDPVAKVLVKIPLASMFVTPKINVFGEEVRQDGNILQRGASNFLDPTNTKVVRDNPLNQKLMDLAKETDDNKALFQPLDKKVRVRLAGKMTEKVLTPRELEQFKREAGKMRTALAKQILNNPIVESMPAQSQAELYQSLEQVGIDYAKWKLYGHEPEKTSRPPRPGTANKLLLRLMNGESVDSRKVQRDIILMIRRKTMSDRREAIRNAG